jgi:thiol:disulfide interchange protein
MGIKDIFMKFLNPKKMSFWMILLGILLIFGGVYVYKQSKDKVTNDPKNNNIPNASSQPKEMVFHFFYADWCPHCKTAKIPWQTFSSNRNGKVVNGYKIICKPHDCTDSTSDIPKRDMEKFKVEGFPTLVVQKDGKNIDFDAKITEYSLAQFVERMT